VGRRLSPHTPLAPPGLLVGGLLAGLLLLAGEVAPGVFPLRVAIEARGGALSLLLDGARHDLQRPVRAWTRVRLDAPGPAEREVQIDGSETVGRGDRDPEYIASILDTPLYVLTSWLGDGASISRWDQTRLIDLDTGQVVADGPQAVQNASLPSEFQLELALRHPEAPARVWLTPADQPFEEGLELDRTQRQARWVREPGTGAEPVHWFFPEQPMPFAANLLHLLGRAAAAGFGLVLLLALLARLLARWPGFLLAGEQRLTTLARPASLVLLGLLMGGSAWISVALYRQLPHILDASEYYLQAGMFASGHLWFDPPPLANDFGNYSQVIWEHRWFAHYPPGAAAAYAVGRLAGLAWLVGPLAAVVMVLGTAVTARTWFGPRAGLAALGLGSLSPFVLFQAGSFLSHPIAGAALGGSLAAFSRGEASRRRWPWPFLVVGVLLGWAFLTREMSAGLFGLPLLGWLLAHRRWRPLLLIGVGILPCLAVYLGYNLALTRDPLLLPRITADATDHPGFGDVGQFGRHTLAAGFVNAEQDLNALQLDLFGWPPLFALGLLALPFLLGQAVRRDLMLASGALLFVGGCIAFYAHGIGALGPRYYYEGLPWFILLAVRGLQVSVATAANLGVPRVAGRAAALGLIGLLGVYAYGYYVPRLVERRVDFTALSGGRRYSYPFVVTSLTGPYLQGVESPSIVLVPDEGVFKTLSAMNCAQLDAAHVDECPVLFLHAGEGDLEQVLEAFPGRSVLKAQPQGQGRRQVVALAPVSAVVAQR
jgi:hypothetical protein